MNKTTKNYLKALANYTPPECKPTIWRLVYDPESGKAIDLIVTETDLPNIVVSRNEADTYPHLDPRVRVVNGKITRLIKKMPEGEISNNKCVKLAPNGNIATDDYNMLIINKLGNKRWTYG